MSLLALIVTGQAVPVGPSLTVVANPDATYTISGDGVVANPDGTYTIAPATENPDGTYTITGG